jgi:2,4-dienoyl-CoA reductase-like NADH-dependent reductase (Old Yellow Enzyme family)
MDSELFQSVRIGGYELKNRFLMSAAAAWKATEEGDIAPGQPILQLKIARGGLAMIINGGVGVHSSGRISPHAPLFNDDRRIPSFKSFAEAIHEGGAAVAFQLTHAGMWAAPYQMKTGSTPFAPSFIINDAIGKYRSPARQDCATPPEKVREIIAAYGDGAARAKEAGYNAVEVHAAHESLLAQFLSPVTNVREDEWGGSIENRCRIHCEVLADIRKKVGPGFPVMIKLGVQDGLEGGLPLDEGVAAAKIIARAGDVDAIEVSQGLSASLTDPNDTSMKMGITSIEKEGYYRPWTKKVKDAVRESGKSGNVLVIMQGGLRSFELMEEVVRNGEADLVSMCRPYIREPMLIKRWMSGDRRKATCISCNECLKAAYMQGKPLVCRLKSGGNS